MLRSAVRVAGALALIASNVLVVAGDNTTCPGDLLDWYTDIVGETPCMTYQRLRQLCDPQYTVPLFRTTAPGDNCDSSPSICCCNSVAYSLSMLCMNCQEHAVANGSGSISAPRGGYYEYRWNSTAAMNNSMHQGYCGDGYNGTLPDQVQNAVCNSGLKIADWLYPVYWTNGAWFYTNFKNQVTLNQTSSNNNTFTHCNATDLANSTSTSAATSSTGASSTSGTPSATSVSGAATSSSNNTGAIVGGVVGGVGGLALIVLAALFFLRRRRAPPTGNSEAAVSAGAPPMSSVGPPVPPTPNAHGIVPYDVPQAYAAAVGRPISGKEALLAANMTPTASTSYVTTTAPSEYSAVTGAHTGTDSASAVSSSDARGTVYARPVVLEPEEDAGRLTALRPPPAYRSSWDDRQYP